MTKDTQDHKKARSKSRPQQPASEKATPATKAQLKEEKNQDEKRKDDALAVLRTETALSRFPMHRLTKGKSVKIEIKNQASAVFWKVSPNADYGQPGALAYKLDTLFINRRIEEAGRPTPKTIRLGSLREIAEEMGLGTNTNAVKEALLQNATASITAKINYRTQNDGEQWLEAVFNRYSLVFTGEKFPDGGTADAVHLVLNDIYQQILSTAVFRPLDYDYMKALPPIAQRFYEIVSYQIYAAVHHGNPRAKLLYSDYCLLSTATRYFDFDHVKKQMYKVLRPHTQSGYIAKVEYESITNEQGEADWQMFFTPGPNAGREYQAFTGIGKTRKPRARKADKTSGIVEEPTSHPTLPFGDDTPQIETSGTTASILQVQSSPESSSPDSQGLIQLLVEAQLNRSDAERFARDKPEECGRQLEYLPYVKEFKTSQGAYLRRAIEEGYGPPKAYTQIQASTQAEQVAQQRSRNTASEASQVKARQGHQERFYGVYLGYVRERVGEAEKTQPETFTEFQAQEAEERRKLTSGPFAGRPLTQKALEVFDQEASRVERAREFWRGRGVEMPDFWEWDQAVNDSPFGSS